MPELQEKIRKDIIKSLKERDEVKVSALRMLQAAIEHKFIENKKQQLKDEDIIRVLKKQIGQIRDSIDAFRGGMREDLAQREEAALAILKQYLPPQATSREIEQAVLKAKEIINPQNASDFGRVMKEAMSLLEGKADGRQVSLAVREALSEKE